MSLISYPQTLSELFASQCKPLLGLIISCLILSIIKRMLNNRHLNRVKLIDLFPVFAIIAIPILTINGQGNTFLPILIFIWMIIGIIWIIYLIFSRGELVLKKYLIAFWRFGDLYWLFFYFLSFAIKIIV
ncbi:DUF3397 family protein [Fructilactobacillus sanfranciscensis]|uniref:DUF3397 family protein n=1 Tax=Fructilactobacillus sanfranciscensis TaxID=1625 RepID=UPI000CD450E0|nr:DUF3397 family protein [Fructilactobacillus sanfranciscensis]NDR69341.1 DUF3397 family protein [Fructilactobacillus sanfranciscensis]NDS15949.1 DUF3397 family protein [Fructilactobacillus sanfranciscensis]POH13892.1 hypothetical protein BGL41_02170 [Fructilactobacillus sanfranciscensis]POH21854.1 hypothetical protein BGL46_00170 [Fructilactobacillus sanfranciscensis]TNK96492.1 DUF3397 domain-containing protein [Fructilactobacillus sanfranciscensis]